MKRDIIRFPSNGIQQDLDIDTGGGPRGGSNKHDDRVIRGGFGDGCITSDGWD